MNEILRLQLLDAMGIAQYVPRELHEELGLDPATLPPVAKLFKLPPSEATGWEFVRVYLMNHEGPFELNEAEVESGLWLSPKSLDAAVKSRPEEFTPSFVLIWTTWRAAKAALK